MKIQLDTGQKTITLDENINLKELSKILLKLFPNKEWEEYILVTNTSINNWNYPIIIKEYTNPYPWWTLSVYGTTTDFTITSSINTSDFSVASGGVYNIQC